MMMNSRLLLLVFTIACCVQQGDAQSEVSSKLTTIEFESKIIDYGTIEKGAEGGREFVFTNTGNYDFALKNIFSSCNCDVISKAEAPIAPGEKGKIEVFYDTKKVGPIVKTITVMGNIKEKVIALKLTGTVR